MKVVVKQYWHYIIAAALVIIALCVAFLPCFAVIYSWFNKDYGDFWWNPDYVVIFSVAIFFLIGFVWSDLHKVRYRRAAKNWNKELPPDIREEAWGRCYALYMAATLLLIASIVMLIICKVHGADNIADVITGVK